MPDLGRVGEIIEVHRGGGELFLDWRIPRFLNLSSGGYDFYESTRFSLSGARWFVRVWPNWRTSGQVYLFLFRQDSSPTTRTVNVSLGLRGTGGGVKKRREEEREFWNVDFWLLRNFCTRSELSEQRQRLMPGGALTVTCKIKVSRTTCRGTEKLLEDFGKLLASGDKGDVTVWVFGVEFQVHSHVLFARCPALSISLQHECAEKASNTIVVEDCEPDIFRDFLHFLYTGSVQSLTMDNAFGLYRIADRYLLEDLKRQCLDYIQDTALSVDTFCDALRLAQVHGESDLMEQVSAFAAKNMWSILNSTKWQTFARECPDEANKVLQKSLAPSRKRKKSSH